MGQGASAKAGRRSSKANWALGGIVNGLDKTRDADEERRVTVRSSRCANVPRWFNSDPSLVVPGPL